MQPTESRMHLFFQSFSGRDTDILTYHDAGDPRQHSIVCTKQLNVSSCNMDTPFRRGGDVSSRTLPKRLIPLTPAGFEVWSLVVEQVSGMTTAKKCEFLYKAATVSHGFVYLDNAEGASAHWKALSEAFPKSISRDRHTPRCRDIELSHL